MIYRTGEFSDSVDSLFLTQSCFNTSGFDANSSSKIAKKFCSIQIYVLFAHEQEKYHFVNILLSLSQGSGTIYTSIE